MPGFVIEFNRRTRDRRVTEFAGPTSSRDAMRRRLELEHAGREKDVEIVALTSGSLTTLKKTHARYFTGRELISR